MRQKKASLSLSINAIVILVLAITMLGLGLAFTKGMFGKLSSKLSVPEPDIPATADDKIVLPTEELTITKNKEFIFSVNVYNDDFTGPVTGELTCPQQGSAAAIPENTVTSGPQEIPPGEDKGFKFIINKDLVTQSSTRVCNIKFTGETAGEESKQLVVSIK
ncbi:hypothetical protein KY359_03325 [Candidatus Woesearchaeota archaeon]|nr:hypothetical protein [Candidatus Woesearchaeota archaeon]